MGRRRCRTGLPQSSLTSQIHSHRLIVGYDLVYFLRREKLNGSSGFGKKMCTTKVVVWSNQEPIDTLYTDAYGNERTFYSTAFNYIKDYGIYRETDYPYKEKTMKQSKDPFEVAFEEQEESPPNSPIAPDEIETQTPAAQITFNVQDDEDVRANIHPTKPSTSTAVASTSARTTIPTSKTNKEEDEEEEDENMDVELGKLPSSGDPDKMAKMQSILSQFTEEQMSRYESFRRSGFQKANMKRLLASLTGSAKISIPMTIVVSGIAKMFVGELVETARMVMTERKESGPIRPCHIREAYRRLKLEGKVPKRSVQRLFR